VTNNIHWIKFHSILVHSR